MRPKQLYIFLCTFEIKTAEPDMILMEHPKPTAPALISAAG